jgi:hypothetical protein
VLYFALFFCSHVASVTDLLFFPQFLHGSRGETAGLVRWRRYQLKAPGSQIAEPAGGGGHGLTSGRDRRRESTLLNPTAAYPTPPRRHRHRKPRAFSVRVRVKHVFGLRSGSDTTNLRGRETLCSAPSVSIPSPSALRPPPPGTGAHWDSLPPSPLGHAIRAASDPDTPKMTFFPFLKPPCS